MQILECQTTFITAQDNERESSTPYKNISLRMGALLRLISDIYRVFFISADLVDVRNDPPASPTFSSN